MARETYSEKLVKTANTYYRRSGRANVGKNEPHTRLTGQRLIFSKSGGLDYSGLISGGVHISFELKEVKGNSLPIRNIRMTQIDTMKSNSEFGGASFLLVYFSTPREWYRLEYDQLRKMIDSPYSSIPIRYFRAFGSQVPNPDDWPQYLDPIDYYLKKEMAQGYPNWMPNPRRKPDVKQVKHPGPTSKKVRDQRIMNAIGRGLKNAKRRQLEVEKIKKIRRGDNSNGTQGRYSCEDRCGELLHIQAELRGKEG